MHQPKSLKLPTSILKCTLATRLLLTAPNIYLIAISNLTLISSNKFTTILG